MAHRELSAIFNHPALTVPDATALWTKLTSPRVQRPFVIGLCGASGSGKSTVRDALLAALAPYTTVTAFSQDHYFRDFARDFPQWSVDEFYDRIDFDDPAHIDFDALVVDLARIRASQPGQVLALPKLVYGTPEHKPSRIADGQTVTVAPVVITEGIHAFHRAELRACYDLAVFVDVDEPVRRSRWLLRNQRDNRGTTDNMWHTTVTCLEQHIAPHRRDADIILDNTLGKVDMATLVAEWVGSIMASRVQAA